MKIKTFRVVTGQGSIKNASLECLEAEMSGSFHWLASPLHHSEHNKGSCVSLAPTLLAP